VDFSTQLSFLDLALLARVTTQFPDALTDEERAAISAYLVLFHACIEEYLEDSFSLYLERLARLTNLPLFPLAVGEALLAIGLSLPEGKRAPYKSRTLAGIAQAGLAHFQHVVVGGNNGVKTPNVRRLAEGVGLAWQQFEAALAGRLADLDTLGAKRGAAGHLSPFSMKQVALTAQVYPDDVRGWVEAGRDAAVAVNRYLSDAVEAQTRSLFALSSAD